MCLVDVWEVSFFCHATCRTLYRTVSAVSQYGESKSNIHSPFDVMAGYPQAVGQISLFDRWVRLKTVIKQPHHYQTPSPFAINPPHHLLSIPLTFERCSTKLPHRRGSIAPKVPHRSPNSLTFGYQSPSPLARFVPKLTHSCSYVSIKVPHRMFSKPLISLNILTPQTVVVSRVLFQRKDNEGEFLL